MARYQQLQSALVETYLQTGSCWAAFDAFAKLTHRGDGQWHGITECLLDDFRRRMKDCHDRASLSWQSRGYETWSDVTAFLEQWLRSSPELFNVYAEERLRWLRSRARLDSDCGASTERELCFSKIKLAYDNQVFIGGDFRLTDKSCEPFKAEYDERYVRRSSRP